MNIDIEHSIPFRPFDRKFEEVLATNFIRPAIIWMIRQKGPEILSNIPQTSVEQDSCWWAMALYLEIFINCLEMEELFTLSERKILADKSIHLSEMLLENQSKNGAWDEPKGIWDTSATCRSLLLLIRAARIHNYINLTSELSNKIINAVKKGMQWLSNLVVDWDLLRYPYGPEDLATVLRLVKTIRDNSIDVLPKFSAFKTRLPLENLPKNENWLAALIVARLTQMKTTDSIENMQTPIVYWESPFSTAQIIRGICDAIDLLPDDLKAQGLQDIVGGINYLEQNQEDGRWGLPNTTSVVLEAYIRGCYTVARYENSVSDRVAPQAQIAFKALRWLVEQRALDGSIVHSYWHTAFFILMLQYLILSKYELLRYPVAELYDHVLWESQNMVTRERRAIYTLTNQIVRVSLDIDRYLRLYNSIMTSIRALILVISVYTLYYIFSSLGWLQIGLKPISINLIQPEIVITLMLTILPLLYAFWVYSKKWLKERRNDNKD